MNHIIPIFEKCWLTFIKPNSIFYFKLKMSTTLDFICGLAAGWSQIITGQPLDFIKTKIQLANGTKASTAHFAR